MTRPARQRSVRLPRARIAVAAAALVALAGLVAWAWSGPADRPVSTPDLLVIHEAGRVDRLDDPFSGTLETPCGDMGFEGARFEFELDRLDGNRWIGRLLVRDGTATVDRDPRRPVLPGRAVYLFGDDEVSIAEPATPLGTDAARREVDLGIEPAAATPPALRTLHVRTVDPDKRDAVPGLTFELEWQWQGTRHAKRFVSDGAGEAVVEVPVTASEVRGRCTANDGYADSDWTRLAVLAGLSPERPFLLRAHVERLFQGLVCDADGEPVRGADVLYFPPLNDGPVHLVLNLAGSEVPQPVPGVRVARTDAEGRFSLRLGGLPVVAQAFAGGRSSAPRAIEPSIEGTPLGVDDISAPTHFVLRRTASVALRVTDSRGKPAAEPFAHLLERCSTPNGEREFVACRHFTIDAPGEVRLADAPSGGSLQLLVGARGHAPKPVALETKLGAPHRADVALTEPGRITGRVAALGEPIAGAVVTAWGPEDARAAAARAVTDSDGRFVLEPLPAAEMELRVHPADDAFAARRLAGVLASPDAVPIELQLEAASSVRGRIVDASGHPRPHEQLCLTSAYARDPDALRVLRYATTNENGQFEFGGLPTGSFRLFWQGDARGTLVQSGSSVTLWR